jgi:hypothetical protein
MKSIKERLRRASLHKLCEKLESITLKRLTVQRQVADISEDVKTQFSELFDMCVYYSEAVDLSPDITTTAEMCTLARGSAPDFEVLKNLQISFPINAKPDKGIG